MITNFSLLTISTRAHWVTPNRLGGFTSKSNKCATKIDEARQVLKVRITLICSLALNHIAPTLNHVLSTLLSQREGWGELTQGFEKGFGRSGASVARPRAVGWVYILIPLKLVVRIWKLAVVIVQGRHCRPPRNSTSYLMEKAITFTLNSVFSDLGYSGKLVSRATQPSREQA
jgi:hypothetical protein